MLLRGKLERSEWEEWPCLLVVEGPVIIKKILKYKTKRAQDL